MSAAPQLQTLRWNQRPIAPHNRAELQSTRTDGTSYRFRRCMAVFSFDHIDVEGSRSQCYYLGAVVAVARFMCCCVKWTVSPTRHVPTSGTTTASTKCAIAWSQWGGELDVNDEIATERIAVHLHLHALGRPYNVTAPVRIAGSGIHLVVHDPAVTKKARIHSCRSSESEVQSLGNGSCHARDGDGAQ